MKVYKDFHGETLITDIGKRLREIVKEEKNDFKIMTGYGSTCGRSKSKSASLKSLAKMKKEGLIKDYIPGDALSSILTTNSPYYETKQKYHSLIKNDPDYGNDGIIFIFMK